MEKTISKTYLRWYKDWLLIPLVGIVYVLDQITKYLVESTLCEGNRSIPEVGQFRLTCSYNSGSAFGLFPDQTVLLILASFVGIGVLIFIYRHYPFPGRMLRVSLGLQLGGAIGNLTDRLRFGEVTDFVQLGFWPVFNLADASIVIGVTMLVALFLVSGDPKSQKGGGKTARVETESVETVEITFGDGRRSQEEPKEKDAD